MATKSRTYLPTDWQVWVYTPVAGKFRLDFSALDGADVLGSPTDTGSIQPLSLRINSIQVDDGQRPEQGVFSNFAPATMELSAQLLSWEANTVKELYNGKQIFLTLKNEATNSHPTFGKNTVFFIGQIENLEIQVDPINSVTNLTISASDVLSSIFNQPMTMLKDNATSKGIQLVTAVNNMIANGFVNDYGRLEFDGGLNSSYELNVTQTKGLGEWVNDFIVTEVALAIPYVLQQYSGGSWILRKALNMKTIAALVKNGELIPESIISNILIAQDGSNAPNAFSISNSTSTYAYGVTTANASSNPTVYVATLDATTANLKTIADKITAFSQAIQPTQVTVRTAQSFQTITFDNTRPLTGSNDYTFPKYFWINGQEVKTMPTYTSGTYYHMVVGTSHTIDVDGWTTTYQLWKGL